MDFIKATKKLWDTYLFGNIEDCAELMDGAVPDCVVIGTGEHEIYHDLESFSEALATEITEREQIQFQYKDFWCEVKEITPDVTFVYGGLSIWWEKEDKSVSINMDSRFTIIYKFVDGIWKVVHTHQSMPNREQQDGEYYPKKLLDLYNIEKEKSEELRNLAENDSLTGLLNYKTLQKIFEETTESLRSSAESLSSSSESLRSSSESLRSSAEHNLWLFVIDLDDFKKINDTYGHPEGNYVLKSVADILKSSVRSEDYVCRMGGDEFMLLCRDIPSGNEVGRILNRINETIIKIGDSRGYNISLSIGVTPVAPYESFDTAFEHADKALYEAKKHGKNRWEIASF